MSALDIFVLLLLGGGAVIGFIRGFVHEFFALLAWGVAILLLRMFHTPFTAALAQPVGSETGAAVLAFALLFLPGFIFVRLLAKSLGGRTRRSVLGPLDRLLGGGFGFLKGLLAATLFFLLANLATDLVYGPRADRPDWMRNASTYPLLNASGRAIVEWVETRRAASEGASEGETQGR
jgi:membrane protein required for colicin V production